MSSFCYCYKKGSQEPVVNPIDLHLIFENLSLKNQIAQILNFVYFELKS